jgi:hypothetical protein
LVTQYSCQLFWLAPSRFREFSSLLFPAASVAALTEAALALVLASAVFNCLITVLVAYNLYLSVFTLLSHGFFGASTFLAVSLFCYLSLSSLACLSSNASAASGSVFLRVFTLASSSLSLLISSDSTGSSSFLDFFSSFFCDFGAFYLDSSLTLASFFSLAS